MTVNRSEAEEKRYLEEVVSKLHQSLQNLESKISSTRDEIIESKRYVWTNTAELDPVERAANRMEISLTIDHGEKAVLKLNRIQKLIAAPYFGRVDFVADEQTEAETYYIGVHPFTMEGSQKNVIYDWRSPVASMFYDYQTGKARYSSPQGVVEGEIGLKRQYRIKQSIMEYMIESSMNINDDVLQKELSLTSDEKMKNIVATIQKEQNVIIRDEHSHEMIIQGVAGSGKTSVALHRVAFLLYRYKETLTSQNILIISPNKVFSDYISNVLPELGEENIAEISFDDIAAGELAGLCHGQTFYQQVSELGTSTDVCLIERIEYKASVDFIYELDHFIEYIQENYFQPVDIVLDEVKIDQAEIWNAYRVSGNLPIKLRLEKTALKITGNTKDIHGDKLTAKTATKIRTLIKKMFKTQNLLLLYTDFYNYIGKPEWFKLKKTKTLEFADVFPMVYLKIRLEGSKSYEAVKHLLVDEMQDYTPIQYAVLSRLFKCKKTILGDSNQSVNPYSSSSLQVIRKVFPSAHTVELLRSYRSTMEIIDFAQKINRNSKLIPLERSGPSPKIFRAEEADSELNQINALIRGFLESEHRTLGIVCKTQDQAERMYHELCGGYKDFFLLDYSSDKFHEGIIVTSAPMAKGLEFDRVLIPFTDASNYKTEMDRSLLYIACTRAMHVLTITYFGEVSPLLPPGYEEV
ncbi:helicase [Paenibacillus albidus]|uniref:Helicase n=1 Tax=Paenibacillus albidus TaxID=2041023 RepID=A0A917CAH8_9BACL|nr:UvrD-helicase domain-containing protein [Paenibacillus albidus]GGF79444.1 helicase [Paenibacillus albidus]